MSLEAIVWVLRHSESTLGARLVLLALADYAHEDGSKAFPKIETLARNARMTERGVQKALRRLEETGEIICTGVAPKSGTRVYTIVGIVPVDNPVESGDEGANEVHPRGERRSDRGERRSPDPVKDPSEKEASVVEVAETWGKLAPPLIAHNAAYFDSPRFATAVAAALRTYELQAVVKAIENYAAVLGSKAHYWSHRYSAVDFLRRERATPGVEKFVDEAVPFENFRTKKDDDREGKQQRTPAEQLSSAEAWILNTAWRLPLEEWDVAEQLGQRGVEGPDRARLLELWRQKRDLAA